MAEKGFTFIGGSDDFMVTRLGKSRFEELAAGVDEEFAREVIDGSAGKVEAVEQAVERFIQAVNTMPMFGGRKAVWFKDVSFLGDTVTGRAEETLAQVKRMREALETIDPDHVSVVITAAPLDRRREFAKWVEKNSRFEWIAGPGEKGVDLAAMTQQEAEARRARISPDAARLLIAKVGSNSRLLVEEVRKLATYLGEDGATIDEKLVAELVPEFGEGDFFESAEAFLSGDLNWIFEALRRHFFSGYEARGLITSLQRRNSLLIQLRVLLDSGEIRFGHRGLDEDSFARAAETHRRRFGDKVEKNESNVFTQNIWYLGRLAEAAKRTPLKRLIDFQQDLLWAFEEIVNRPNEQEEVMRELAVRSIGSTVG